jgi:glycosyltransferase involved in cell wall biosynthesis
MEAASVTGPAKNLLGFCRWLQTVEGARTGLRIAIATFDRNARTHEKDSFVAAARAMDVNTHVIHERFRFDPGVVPQLRRIADRERPDIIQTHNGKSHLLIKSLPDLRSGRLWFAFEHGQVHTDAKLKLLNQLDRVSLRSAARVISVCKAFAPRLITYGVRPERIRVLHNAALPAAPVTTEERAALRARLGIGAAERVVLTIGRLSWEKGHADLVNALGRAPSLAQQCRLLVVGIGPERGSLERLCRALGAADRVIFAGFQRDVTPFLAIADAFVLPSHTEGSSNVLLEAMMSRVPIVATRAGGNPEIVLDEETGLLVPVANPQALAKAIARVLQDRELAARFAAFGYERAAREFSLQRYRSRLLGYYEEALGRATNGTVENVSARAQ